MVALSKAASVLACLVGLAGCQTQIIKDHVDGRSEKVQQVVEAVQQSAADRMADAPYYARVRGLWISDRASVRSPGDALPPAFSRSFVFRRAGMLSFNEFVQVMQQASGANVSVAGDDQGIAVTPIEIAYEGTLRGFLTTATSRFGVGYAWRDSGLELTQTEARVFPVQRTGSDVRSLAGRRDPFVDLENGIKTLAPRAKVMVSRASNSITVVDRPSSMRDIERFLQLDAEQANRSVLMRWQLISYQADNSGEASLAVNYMLKRAMGQLSVASGLSASPNVDKLSYTINDPTRATVGSNAVLNVLNQTGKATVVRDGLLPIANNDTRVYEVTLRSPFPEKTSLASVPAIGTTSGLLQTLPITELTYEEVGLTMKVSATVFASDEVDLTVDFKLKQITRVLDFSSSVFQQKAPEMAVHASTGMQRAKHGESILFLMDNSDETSFTRQVGLSIGETGTGSKAQWLILLTPIITRGST